MNNSNKAEVKKVFYTTKELEKMGVLRADTLRNMRAQKKGIPYVKIGGAVRYHIEDIEKFIGRVIQN